MFLGYDTNQNGKEDALFVYELGEADLNGSWTFLRSYIVDLNKDGEFSDDEWVEYNPEEEPQSEN